MDRENHLQFAGDDDTQLTASLDQALVGRGHFRVTPTNPMQPNMKLWGEFML